MLISQEPITTVIQNRYSCRNYTNQPISMAARLDLENCLQSIKIGPLGTSVRFILAAATEQDRSALRGLGTYGFIKGVTGFIIGAAGPGEMNLEDYGYTLEQAVLSATALGLNTCWLGGAFTKSSFANKIGLRPGEIVPAVAATGYAVENARARDWSRRSVHADSRFPWDKLFFLGDFAHPLTAEQAGAYAMPLEMLRLGPSAKNYQPWRLVQDGSNFHFYLQRTKGYNPSNLYFKLLGAADLQRIDSGIAMCNFEQAARQVNLQGHWVMRDPGLEAPDDLTSYVVTWEGF